MISQQYISAENAHAIIAIKQLSHSRLSWIMLTLSSNKKIYFQLQIKITVVLKRVLWLYHKSINFLE